METIEDQLKNMSDDETTELENALAPEPSLVDIAKEKLESMEAADVRKLITSGKSTWTRGQNVTMKVDRLAGNEKDLFQGDDELIELLVLEQVVSEKIRERMNLILARSREVPYQISARGIRVRLEAYDQEKLKATLDEAGIGFEVDRYEDVVYIKRVNKYKGVEGSIPDIKPILDECCIVNGI